MVALPFVDGIQTGLPVDPFGKQPHLRPDRIEAGRDALRHALDELGPGSRQRQLILALQPVHVALMRRPALGDAVDLHDRLVQPGAEGDDVTGAQLLGPIEYGPPLPPRIETFPNERLGQGRTLDTTLGRATGEVRIVVVPKPYIDLTAHEVPAHVRPNAGRRHRSHAMIA